MHGGKRNLGARDTSTTVKYTTILIALSRVAIPCVAVVCGLWLVAPLSPFLQSLKPQKETLAGDFQWHVRGALAFQ